MHLKACNFQERGLVANVFYSEGPSCKFCCCRDIFAFSSKTRLYRLKLDPSCPRSDPLHPAATKSLVHSFCSFSEGYIAGHRLPSPEKTKRIITFLDLGWRRSGVHQLASNCSPSIMRPSSASRSLTRGGPHPALAAQRRRRPPGLLHLPQLRPR